MASTTGTRRKGKGPGKTAPRTTGAKSSGAKSSGRKPSRAKTTGAKASGAKASTAKTSGAGARRRTGGGGGSATSGLRMHTAHASIAVPYVTKDDLAANARAAESAMPDIKLPPAERLAFYGGLGALAVVGVVEWPVAAAIGAATVIARRSRRAEK